MFEPFSNSLMLLNEVLRQGDTVKNAEGKLENGLTKSPKGDIINQKTAARDGGAGSGNFGHRGIPGKQGGSAPDGTTAEVTRFSTVGGEMKITSDLRVKASKSGKTTVTIKAGREIKRVYSFAGKGSSKKLNVAGQLAKQYGGDPRGWAHLCGFASVTDGNGSETTREIHWFEHDEIGQIKFKVKKRDDST